MAYFRCVGGSGGAGATITVTYSSQFYNKTMTCSNGTKTYTKITTSSGSTVFDVDETGTWTITCDGTSRTVDVVLEYSTQMSITKTITVYSAASETISFTDQSGSKTVTTDSSGEGSVSITFIPNSAITFTSSIAKNPSDLSQAYSKSVTLNSNTTSIYVMPDGNVLYWYGYKGNDYSFSQSHTDASGAFCNFNTNEISTGIEYADVATYTFGNIDVTSNNYIRGVFASKDDLDSTYLQYSLNCGSVSVSQRYAQNNFTNAYLSKDISSLSGNQSISVISRSDGNYGGANYIRLKIYALWAE